jgi:hypothetical protein
MSCEKGPLTALDGEVKECLACRNIFDHHDVFDRGK